ncbi:MULTISPECIES: hypothetical protein [Klebsiella]|uniref:hypothetical protein n=1 Tax=Klebsiella TaxID=570 RepID=UPI00063C3532|nr:MULTISPECIES: hypothetical protein [Klebsiella]EIW9479581.1 hypothetical protein [Klebsiella aerogenes]EIW9499785.1 hypothetical protein [Klebsiella aerogenes]EKM7513285.1 hypothetical protein [Klebsiella aerogenes]EKV8810541.1 hypothetical protein [Klebsiella aerogenes]ELJ2009429.1 hypothetical protein [Klebsiella aerogenes]
MKVSLSKWLLILLYLVIALPIGIFIATVATQVVIKLFYFITSGLSMDLLSIDYVKILKGSVVGGVIGAIGCWFVYYQHYRKNRRK